MRPAPHDLCRLAVPASLRGADGAAPPPWVAGALAAASWVVARRAPAPGPGRIAVGVRGVGRDQRWAAVAPLGALGRPLAPEDLPAGWTSLPDRRRTLPALALVPVAAALLARLGLVGGPGGSVGFELASGAATVTPSSDLDLIVRVPDRPAAVRALVLLEALPTGRARGDILLETPAGGIALAELARGGPVALRTADGPRLVDDPWATPPAPTLRPKAHA